MHCIKAPSDNRYILCVYFPFTSGNIHLQFHSSGNHYVWSKVTSTVHNIIVGKLWIDQVCEVFSYVNKCYNVKILFNHHCCFPACCSCKSGDIDIVNNTTKDTCRLKFSPYSYFSRDVPRKVSRVHLLIL